MGIKLQKPKSLQTNSSVTTWLKDIADNAPSVFMRRAAKSITSTGFYSIQEFFDDLKDNELYAINYLLEQKDNENSLLAIQMITILLSIGSSVYFATQEEIDKATHIFAGYVAFELVNRKHLSSKELREKRKSYEIDKMLNCFAELKGKY